LFLTIVMTLTCFLDDWHPCKIFKHRHGERVERAFLKKRVQVQSPWLGGQAKLKRFSQ